jgi:hypothetical protein
MPNCGAIAEPAQTLMGKPFVWIDVNTAAEGLKGTISLVARPHARAHGGRRGDVHMGDVLLGLTIRDIRQGNDPRGTMEFSMAKVDILQGMDEWGGKEPPEFDDARGALFPCDEKRK